MSQNVCATQDRFNMAFKNALDEYPILKNEELSSSEKTWMTVIVVFSLILWFILILWAILLAIRVKKQKPLNITVAALFSPIYILAFYLSAIVKYN